MRAAVIALALVGAAAFQKPAATKAATQLAAYVPSGMSKAEYDKIKKKEADDKKKKAFGAGGARGFESRSMASFMRAQERGEAEHLFPVDPAKVRSGEIALKDVPYMQRGGSWDNSDLTGKKGWQKTGFGMTAFNDGKAEKKRELASDKRYNNVKPDIGIFGAAVNWGGGAKGAGKDDITTRAKKNGISGDQQMWQDAGALSKQEIARMNRGGGGGGAPKIGGAKTGEKKFFGLF